MAIKLASLFIELAANGDKLTAELKKSTKSTKKWSKEVKKATDLAKKGFAAVSVGAGLATGAMTAVYVSNANTLDRLGKLAAQLDDQADRLRVVGVAAEYAGVGAESMYKNLERMIRRLGDVKDGAGPTAEAIEKLGLDFDEIKSLAPSVAFEKIAVALEDIEGAADKASIANAIFGRSGLGAVVLTTSVLKKAKDDVDALGGALSNLEISRIENANDAVFRVGLGFDLLTDKFTAKMAPAVENIANALFDSAAQSQQFEGTMNQLFDSVIVGVGDFTQATGRVFKFIDGRPEIAQGGLIGYLLGGKLGFLAGSAAGAAFESFDASFNYFKSKFDVSLSDAEKAEIALKKVVARINLLETPGIGSIVVGREEELQMLEEQRRAVVTILSDMGEYDRITETLFKKSNSALNTLGETLVTVGDAISRTVTDPQVPLVGVKKSIDNTFENTGSSGEPIGGNSDDTAANDPLAPGYDDAPMELIRTRLEEENDLKTQLRSEYFANALAEEQQFQNTWTVFQDSGSKDRLKILVNETSGALATLAQHSRTMFELNKAVGLANATVYIATGITRAFSELPFPAALGASVKIGLTGLAQIQTITKAKYGKGDVTTPGAGGATLPTADVSSPNSNVAANDPSISDNLRSQNSGGGLVAVFTSPGASEEQRADEYAQAMQIAQDNDLLVPNRDGGLTYTGTGGSSYTPPAWERSA